MNGRSVRRSVRVNEAAGQNCQETMVCGSGEYEQKVPVRTVRCK